jgi:hypothetical protein
MLSASRLRRGGGRHFARNDGKGVARPIGERTYTHPASSRRAIASSTAIPSSLSLRHGSAANFSPPAAWKYSAFSTPISSNVSRQSAAKPGVSTARRFTPCWARVRTVWSV